MQTRPTSQQYLFETDRTMRNIVNSIPDTVDGFAVMLRYALGWVDANDEPYQGTTGKRIRPLLLLLCTEAAGGNWNIALPAAAAVELLHNFSLIHDDIQDDSATRHGRPTVWKVWGRSNAINAGDALFTLSYCALENLTNQPIPPATVLKIWHVFNQTALELTRGQHLDMRFEKQSDILISDYLSMIQGKSAALIAGAAQIGAFIASGDESQAVHYANFGLNLGIAFQIRDDILGIWGDPEVTGKSAATDIISRKKSLPILFGLSHSQELRDIYTRQSFTESDVASAVKALSDIGAQAYSQEMETTYYQQAMTSLESANPNGRAANELVNLVKTLFRRQY